MTARVLVGALALTLFAAPLAAEAQPAAGKVWRIGILADAPPTDPRATAFWMPFVQGLRELGYMEGQNIVIEPRYAEGRLDRFRDLATELVSLKVDVILAVATGAAVAARKATSTIPTVFANVADPITPGLVTSLARPGA